MEVLKKIEIATACFELLPGDVVRVEYKKFYDEIDVPEAMAHTEAVKQIGQGRPLHILIDFRDTPVSFSNDAREYFAKSPTHSSVRKSQALVVSSLAQKLVANFYLRFTKPTCPAAVFTQPEKALEWFQKLERKEVSMQA